MNTSTFFNTLWPFSWPGLIPTAERSTNLVADIAERAESLRHATDEQLREHAAEVRHALPGKKTHIGDARWIPVGSPGTELEFAL